MHKTPANLSLIYYLIKNFQHYRQGRKRTVMAHLKFSFCLTVVAIPLVMLQCDRSQPITVEEATTDKLFPTDSGIINVKTAYGAKGDGVADDTQSLLNAIRANVGNCKTLYFPRGTYLVSNRLEWKDANGQWKTCLSFQGQNRQETIIKLKTSASGYDDSTKPKAVIYTASSLFVEQPYGGGKDYPGLGEGNEAFGNYIQDLTVDTGSNNQGAIAIDYLANNHGAIRDVTIRGQGAIGLNMSRKWPGPCLIKNVQIEGFNYGIATRSQAEYSITFDTIALFNQKSAGIINDNNILSIRGLISNNTIPVIKQNGIGLVTLLDGTFSGGAASVSAIHNTQGSLFARNIKTTGYKSAIKDKGNLVAGADISEFVSGPIFSLFSSLQRSLNLPTSQTPTFHDNNLSNWANVTAFGAKPDDWNDDTAAIQAAIDSGKSTIYFPTGRYFVNNTIFVRGDVKKIMGMSSTIAPAYGTFNDGNNPKPLFRIEPGNADAIIVENLDFSKLHQSSPSPGAILFEQASPQKLVLKDIRFGGEYKFGYRNTMGAGFLFIENATGNKWQFDYPQTVWATQLNTEGSSQKIVNNGAKLWILGMKTEGANTVIETKGGGQTELLGGLLYPATTVPTTDTAFINRESQHSLVYATLSYTGNSDYINQVQETRGGITKTLLKSNVSGRGLGSVVPLEVGY